MAIGSFEELLDGLRGNPGWQAQLRALLLTDELLALPAAVAGLVDGQREMQRAIATLHERDEALWQALAQLTRRVDQLGERVDQLGERVDQLGERVDQLGERVDQLARRIVEGMAALIAAQETTEVRLQGLAEQLSAVSIRTDRAIGYMLEQQYRGKAHAYFQTIARRMKVLGPEEVDLLLDAALDAGQIEPWEAEQVRWADAVIRGRREDQPVLLVLEVSVAVDSRDVGRAADRAAILAKTGTPALAIAAGDFINPEAAPLARERSVWLVTDGHVEAPAA
jgi:uncharacterized protein YoxC